MEKDRKPILGISVSDSTCGRAVYGGLCGRPATHHIIWGRYASVSCTPCLDYLAAKGYEYEQIHQLTDGCVDPESLWFKDEGVCRPAKSPEDWNKGKLVLG